MDKQNRKAIIAGNWKMNKTATEAKALISELIPAVKDAGCEVVICVPFTDLVTAVEMTKGTNIHVGAENVHFEKSGAFTGEISADMLTDLGVEYVVIGHSERRQYFAETNETVNKRTKAALAGGLKPIICVGESLDQREQGVTEELVRMQVKMDTDLETNIAGLHCLGDSSGWTRGLMMASVMGVLMGRKLMEKHEF